MKSLALSTVSNKVVHLSVKRTGPGNNIDILLDRLVSQLWVTYRELGRLSRH